MPRSTSIHFDHILGTSLDIVLRSAKTVDLERVEAAVLSEIERLRRIFSVFDPDSELSLLNRSMGPVPVSADLIAVLRACEKWQRDSLGAMNPQAGALVNAWHDATQAGSKPDSAELARIVGQIRPIGWRIDEARGTVARCTELPLNLNSAAKGWIIERAAATALAADPNLNGLLLNLGGDIVVRGSASAGERGWLVGVQDPFCPQENAPLLTALRLESGAVATSGGYQRFHALGSQRWSHLIDPRTGQTADAIVGATVIADCADTANVLATTLCILSPEEGLRLSAATPRVHCLLVTAAGEVLRSPGFAVREVVLDRYAASADQEGKEAVKADPWPDGHQVTIAITLPAPPGKARRPYVAVWIENAEGKPVRTITVWGNSSKWIRDLSIWWKIGKEDSSLVKAVTRATRAPGKYEVVWDGKNDKGELVGQGTYTVRVEVHREHGKHVSQSGEIKCGAKSAKITLEKNAETDATIVEYKEKKK